MKQQLEHIMTFSSPSTEVLQRKTQVETLLMQKANGLLLQAPRQAPLALKQVDAMVYQLANLEDTITFLRNEQGTIDMLILQHEASQLVARKRTAAQTS